VIMNLRKTLSNIGFTLTMGGLAYGMVFLIGAIAHQMSLYENIAFSGVCALISTGMTMMAMIKNPKLRA